MIEMVENSLMVRMANTFAQQTPYRLNTRTHYLFWHFLTRIDPFSKKIDDVVIPISDIRELLIANSNSPEGKRTVHWGSFKEEIERSVAELKSYVVLLPSKDGVKENGEIVKEPITIFKSITPIQEKVGKASFKFTIDPEMKGYLYALAHKFVSFQLLKDVRVKNKYACRLYPALKSRADSQKQYKEIPIFELTVSELRQLLLLGNDNYIKSYDLKRYIIEKAIDDINKNSDIRVWPTYINKGRKLTKVRFNISVSRYNSKQLSLSLSEKGDKYYKYLKRISKKKYSDIDLKEFIAFYPNQYSLIVEEAKETWELYNNEVGGKVKEDLDPTILQGWLEGTIRTNIIDFARKEFDLIGA